MTDKKTPKQEWYETLLEIKQEAKNDNPNSNSKKNKSKEAKASSNLANERKPGN